jgi:hypothetical protein
MKPFRRACLTAAREQRAQHEERRAQLLHGVRRRLHATQVPGVHQQRAEPVAPHAHAQRLQHAAHAGDVAQRRDVVERLRAHPWSRQCSIIQRDFAGVVCWSLVLTYHTRVRRLLIDQKLTLGQPSC